jgi:hypothetical protein
MNDARSLIDWVRSRLNGDGLSHAWRGFPDSEVRGGSAVLFLLSLDRFDGRPEAEPCLILNKRSSRVLQPGDLCCPGGGVGTMDRFLARLLRWPLSPLFRWPKWRYVRDADPRLAQALALLLGTGLREAWEEMRLNPLRVRFLGPLQLQNLIMFKRSIYPLACWVPGTDRLRPNWEVDRIVRIPLRRLLQIANYGRYRLRYRVDGVETRRDEDFPCYIHNGHGGKEVLWGATFRITMDFLKRVFDFTPPEMDAGPVIHRQLEHGYLNGSRFIETDPRAAKPAEN